MSRAPRLNHPGVDPDCPQCKGSGLQVLREGEVAGAQVCVCATSHPCPVCKDTGWIKVSGEDPSDRRTPVVRCACKRFTQHVARFGESGIPGRLADCTFDTYRITDPRSQADAFRMAQAMAGSFTPGGVNRGLVLWGPVGRGKTHLLVAMLRELALTHSVNVRFIEFSHLLAALKARFDRGKGAAELLDELVQVEVLAIDELGKGMLTEFELSVVDELVSRRYNAARTVLATTNYRPGTPTGQARPNLADPRPDQQPTLSDRVGERVYSRLSEMCEFRHLGGSDWRQRTESRW